MSDFNEEVRGGECLPPAFAQFLLESAPGPNSVEGKCLSFIDYGLDVAKTAPGRKLLTGAICSILNMLEDSGSSRYWYDSYNQGSELSHVASTTDKSARKTIAARQWQS